MPSDGRGHGYPKTLSENLLSLLQELGISHKNTKFSFVFFTVFVAIFPFLQ